MVAESRTGNGAGMGGGPSRVGEGQRYRLSQVMPVEGRVGTRAHLRLYLSIGNRGGNVLRGLPLRSSRPWSRRRVLNGARPLPGKLRGFTTIRGPQAHVEGTVEKYPQAAGNAS